MYFPAFLVGAFCVLIAAGYWYLIRQTPKDKMIPWGFLARALKANGRKEEKTMPFPSTFRNILCSCYLKHFWTHHSAGTLT
jgi:hypothetical protein